jgi:hypothetical protein
MLWKEIVPMTKIDIVFEDGTDGLWGPLGTVEIPDTLDLGSAQKLNAPDSGEVGKQILQRVFDAYPELCDKMKRRRRGYSIHFSSSEIHLATEDEPRWFRALGNSLWNKNPVEFRIRRDAKNKPIVSITKGDCTDDN